MPIVAAGSKRPRLIRSIVCDVSISRDTHYRIAVLCRSSQRRPAGRHAFSSRRSESPVVGAGAARIYSESCARLGRSMRAAVESDAEAVPEPASFAIYLSFVNGRCRQFRRYGMLPFGIPRIAPNANDLTSGQASGKRKSRSMSPYCGGLADAAERVCRKDRVLCLALRAVAFP